MLYNYYMENGRLDLQLKSMHVENFKYFEKIDVKFNNQLSVIVGENGSGKSSILEAAKIILGTFFSKINGISAPSFDKRDVRLKSYEMGESDVVQEQYPVKVSANVEIKTYKAPIPVARVLSSSKTKTTINTAKYLVEYGHSAQLALQEGDESLILPIIAYYGTGRLWNYHKSKINPEKITQTKRIDGYKGCLEGSANFQQMMLWLFKKAIQDFQKQNSQEDVVTLKTVLGAIAKCYQNISGYDNAHIQFNFDSMSLEVAYKEENGQHVRLPFDLLSDGYRCTISLIADIAYRMAALNPQLKESVLIETPGVVLIDEVDLHLHPAWQKRVLKDLTTIFPKVQFIVTTHAASVINSVKKENLIILKNCQAIYMDSEVYGKDVKSVMDEIMGVSDRPDDVKSLFEKFDKALNDADFKTAEMFLDQISTIRGGHDPELAKCQTKLRLEQMRKRG